MTTYTLRKISSTVWDITTGRKKAGFVQKVPAGYVARIGNICETMPTAEAAFRLVVAKTLGFASPSHLARHNAEVRHQNRQHRAAAHQAAAAAQSGDWLPLLNLIGRLK